jgi:hypothetical protein
MINGGCIIEAVLPQKWSGEAQAPGSIVNFDATGAVFVGLFGGAVPFFACT